ncbi:hypothetical protein [Pedobacter africanus]|uniref:LamG domain-containing protein n=1 Tax=Pedobacter africanus TaxID=151894 RepID=A0A1W2BPD6_9SPHI|nr:hypothetical protein [Pedobacter africanus]SMC74797.1 hypothetical protein SAMN04488524_2533 [Pedobacter africanus]
MRWTVKSKIMAIAIVLMNQLSLSAQNLLNMQDWVEGQGSAGIFGANGSSAENVREWGIGPHGKRVLLWKAIPDGNSNADGGWNSLPFAINHNSMYRFTVWMKKTNSVSGDSYLGCGEVLGLDGVANGNPYFWYGDLPELNKWYLIVGYVHGSGDPSTTSYGGIYDGVTGAKVNEIMDYKFSTSSTTTYHRSYLYYDPDVNDRQYFYAPRVDMVNGDEPSIASLLGVQPSSSEQSYFSGKVGIGTTDTKGYKLAVAGNMVTESVKVSLQGAWPDYVFTKEHQLPTLQETEKHIKDKGHLPGIPSAAEVKAGGIDLGEMNAKLLQKIEELTLHLIEMDKRLIDERKVNQNLEERLRKTEIK